MTYYDHTPEKEAEYEAIIQKLLIIRPKYDRDLVEKLLINHITNEPHFLLSEKIKWAKILLNSAQGLSDGKKISDAFSFTPFASMGFDVTPRETQSERDYRIILGDIAVNEFRAYDSLEEILKEWPQSTTTFSEVKFVKPNNLTDWQSTIYRCATMVKVFKTLDEHMDANTHRYNFVYQCKTFFKNTTHVFEYDPRNFAFVIRTGLGSGGQVITNKHIPFYKKVHNQLQELVNEMKKELPKSHFDQVFAMCILIRDKQQA